MAVRTRYVIKGSGRAESAISRFMSRIENFQEAGPKIHRVVVSDLKKTFKTEGRNINESWPKYTGQEALYGFIKRKMLGDKIGSRLLRWEPGNERLYPSVVDSRHPEHVWRVKGKEFQFGTRVPYAYKHQYGKGRGPWWAGFGKVKRRTFLGLSRKAGAEIRRRMARHVGI